MRPRKAINYVSGKALRIDRLYSRYCSSRQLLLDIILSFCRCFALLCSWMWEPVKAEYSFLSRGVMWVAENELNGVAKLRQESTKHERVVL